MTEVVNEIKDQFARVLKQEDWEHLLEVAEYHFESAAKLRKKNIHYGDKKLLLRNSMKRLHLGIGVELALKSAFLKKGICINKLTSEAGELEKSPIHLLSTLDDSQINPKDTFTLGSLIDKYSQVFEVEPSSELTDGLKIAMTFRNKEGHTSFPSHEFDESNYTDISNAVITLYKEAFGKKLNFTIAMKARDTGVFKKYNK
ncbi:hypothetical protein [Photobacterium damselae]|uniref:hypothetical protein n=1 Tax=Photobacterium damselae TaxID=38293 RepID=UPI000E05F858|nr:hypothetical protein [Photobacterium damselae]SUB66099.1 Uncharacterised protein [Photobacterium damselae]